MQSQLSDQSNEEPKSPLHGGDRASYTPLLLAPPKPNEPLMSGSEMRSFILGDGTYQKSRERWDPIPFRLWFGMLLVLGMIFLAVGVEILLFLSKLNNGFNNSLIRAGNTKGIHFFYTAVVVALSLPVVAAFGSVLLYMNFYRVPFLDDISTIFLSSDFFIDSDSISWPYTIDISIIVLNQYNLTSI